VTVEDMQREAEEKTKESGQDGDDEGSDDSE